MAVSAGLAALDEFRKTGGVVDASDIDWQRWMKPDDQGADRAGRSAC
jgi:hypothetical protein